MGSYIKCRWCKVKKRADMFHGFTGKICSKCIHDYEVRNGIINESNDASSK